MIPAVSIQENVSKLLEKQEKSMLECQDKLAQWRKFHSDYAELQKTLDTLPDRLNYDVMVPFGSVAFMPGQLVCTNEIMVLLGSDLFVERSAKQASGIVTRRIQQCEKNLKDLESELLQIETWKQHTGMVLEDFHKEGQIIEEYDEELEVAWRERHKAYLRQRSKHTVSSSDENDEFWRRLDELEMKEFEEKQLEAKLVRPNDSLCEADQLSVVSTMTHGVGEPVETTNKDFTKRVAWSENLLGVQQTPEENSILRVNFSEAKDVHKSVPSSCDLVTEKLLNSAQTSNDICSPADIYAMFGSAEVSQLNPKSILKKSAQPNVSSNRTATFENKKEIPGGNPETQPHIEVEAVVHIVTERGVDHSDVPKVPAASRRVSKFKAQRQSKT